MTSVKKLLNDYYIYMWSDDSCKFNFPGLISCYKFQNPVIFLRIVLYPSFLFLFNFIYFLEEVVWLQAKE